MKELYITDKINLTILLPFGKDQQTILKRIGGFYNASIKDGYITVKGVSLLDVGFVVTLINGVE